MNALIPWVGGKRRFLKFLLPLIPQHKTYIEPFFGGGALFFAKDKAKIEIINDIDDNLINLYNVVKTNKDDLIKNTEHTFSSRSLYNKYKNEYKNEEDKVLKAYKYLYVLTNSYRTKMNSCTYGISKKIIPYSISNDRFIKKINEVSQRLERTYIECIQYDILFKRYDHKDSFFFIDPPYHGAKMYDIEKYDIDKMYDNILNFMNNSDSKVLLTCNKNEKTLELFSNLNIKEFDVNYNTSISNNKNDSELIVSNY